MNNIEYDDIVAYSEQINKLNDDLIHALRENKFQLETMDQHDIVSMTDVQGVITYVNDKFCEVSGYSRDELLGQKHSMLKSGFHNLSFYKELWETITQGNVWHGTICNLRKNGAEYWVEGTIVPFLDENGIPYKYVSARTDITEFRQNEQRLQLSQKFANIGTWDWNIRTGDLYWSDSIWPLFGYNKEVTETTYDNFLAAIQVEDRQKVIDAVNNCLNEGAEYNIEHRVVWADGSIHWLLERGDVLRSDKGEPLHMLGMVQDISTRKFVELELVEREQQLQKAQSMAHIGNWQADIKTGELSWSDEIYRIFGFEPNSFKPNVEIFKSAIHPDDIKKVEKSEKHAKLTGTHDVIHRIVQANGSIRHVHELALAELNEKGELIKLTGTVQDITERIEAEQELIKAREEAEEASDAKSQFLSNMSHELRTPLNAIMGFSQLLKMEDIDPLNESQFENVNEILKAGKHLQELINEVLDLAKIESGNYEISIETVILGELIAESLQLITPLAQKRGIEIYIQHNGSNIKVDQLLQQTIAVRADRLRLKQALLNLLSNAVKYNSENGQIIISCNQTDNKQTCISISDKGIGLTAEQQTQLFTAFNRMGAEQTGIEGTGIGLVITKNIIELMGGTIGVNSQPGKGCTFWIELPSEFLLPEQSNIADNIKKTEPSSDSVSEHKHVILYIEDNPANLRLVKQILGQNKNLHLFCAHEPFLGLELAVKHRPDLILLDINLPGLSGFEVLKKLRQSEDTRDTPVIAISANAMPRDIENGLAAGFNEYITKPIDVRLLLQTVELSLQAKA
jgi:PAS domain S-box-containing protein